MRTHLETSGSSKVNKVEEANTLYFLELQIFEPKLTSFHSFPDLNWSKPNGS